MRTIAPIMSNGTGRSMLLKAEEQKTILFVSNMSGDPWGGSEELWTRTAALLARQGVPVAASVQGWPKLDRRIEELSRVGVDVRPRPVKPSLVTLARRFIFGSAARRYFGQAQIAYDVERSFGGTSPGLVVISNASNTQPLEIAETCIARGWPFAIVTHASRPNWWPSGELAAQLRKMLPLARRCFFVAEANRILAEKQIGHAFGNAEVVRNPIVVDIKSPIPWPPDAADQELRMACVGRLSGEKGQDILFDVLAKPGWMERNWRLTLYGDGPIRDVLERLVKRLKLQDRVFFAGHVAVEKIWSENHILVMPSRHEGLPLTIVEAMFCGRPVVATDVGGNSEVIKDGVTGFVAEAAVAECFGRALDRMWDERGKLQEMGKLAAVSIREFMPDDPIGIFAEKLLCLASAPRSVG
jgi:glycosyltransferase involved in cell wall biosynthesis